MQTISLKMDESLLKEIDDSLKKNRYSTRTEFIRDAIRSKLSEAEKEETLRKLAEFKGKFKGRFNRDEEEVRKELGMEIMRKYNLK
jgi:metal-responsive CopG/Arc/MetJ family transcriptional regulator